MASGKNRQARDEKLRSALRDNLKKRKVQTRKINRSDDDKGVALRDRELNSKAKK